MVLLIAVVLLVLVVILIMMVPILVARRVVLSPDKASGRQHTDRDQ